MVAQTARDSRRIYYIMKSVIADRTGNPIEQITPEYIHSLLLNAGMPTEQLHEWDEFALLLTQQVYAYHHTNQNSFRRHINGLINGRG